MNRAQITQAMQDEVLKSTALQKRYESTIGLYQAACMVNDGVQADKYRQELHNLLDMLLDALAVSQMLHRQFLALKE